MGVKVDLTGKKFGKLTVIKEIPRPDNINGHDWSTKWEDFRIILVKRKWNRKLKK